MIAVPTLAALAVVAMALMPVAHADLTWSERIELGAALQEIRGHIWAVERNIDGQKPGFEGSLEYVPMHTFHPNGEVYPDVHNLIGDSYADTDAMLRSALESFEESGLVEGEGATSAVLAAATAARDATDSVQNIVLGSVSANPSLNGAIAASLVTLSADEYDAAVTDGIVEFAVELQDAYAFHHVASEDVFRPGSAYDAEQIQEIDRLFLELVAIYDSRGDPSYAIDTAATLAEKLASSSDQTGTEMKTKSVSVLSDDEKERALEYVANVRMLLSDAKEVYATDTDAALELVREAYINNYEYIEDDIASVGHEELGVRVEHAIREDLISMIRAGDPAVPEMIDNVLVELDMVEQVVPEFGTLAVLVLTAAVASTVVLAARFRVLVPSY